MMVGSWFYLGYKQDWAYMGMYEMLQKRYLAQIANAQGVDLERSDALEQHIDHLERCLYVFGIESKPEQQVNDN